MATKLTLTQRDRLRGAFLGLFVGDALGTTLEFSRRDTLPYQTEITGGGPFNLRPGDWTDDGSMALALACSLLNCRGYDGADACNEWLAWYRTGRHSSNGRCFDIGNTTRAGLTAYEHSRVPSTVHAGSRGRRKVPAGTGAGNGGIMRLAPAAVAYALRPTSELRMVARAQSECTHPAEEASWCAAVLSDVIVSAAMGDLRRVELAELYSGPHAQDADQLRDWAGMTRKQISSSGRARDTLEAALWSVSRTPTFEEALVLAVNLADDSDSVGAVCGQTAGALYGASSIPSRWSDRVAHWETLSHTADALCDLAERLA